MIIDILFGTESGNAELVASDLAEGLGGEHEVQVHDLSEADIRSLGTAELYLVVCSTHGEGEPPQSAVPFIEALRGTRPDLTGVRYAVFGLGDSTYPNYSRGSEHVDGLLRELGAERVGAYGRHDANGREDPSALAIAWAEELLDEHCLTPAGAAL